MRIRDWSSDGCSSDLRTWWHQARPARRERVGLRGVSVATQVWRKAGPSPCASRLPLPLRRRGALDRGGLEPSPAAQERGFDRGRLEPSPAKRERGFPRGHLASPFHRNVSLTAHPCADGLLVARRSEETRVGNGCVSTSWSRWLPESDKKN